ncbi:hypothetical protein PMKS-003240 [Pichia membranifaciens]|uniref:Uncharacterized protein n=1 Tax=Pichia membranifaciens TaxID=4926 RepID=A0A1Q2YJK3_9ASCO|nr:hypothetical protein PMKS-003240 [Pichia membranifaciens]
MEEAANERQRQQRSDDIIVDANSSKSKEEKPYSVEDIQTGTATLESLLEHSINRNFDKFEVYALRNVFTLPEDLVSRGHIHGAADTVPGGVQQGFMRSGAEVSQAGETVEVGKDETTAADCGRAG